ncbi:hypothetical protein F0562_026716 [Nyssa sinensis]|uniref:Protein kinase domain-containing protein n=1 Tax=Nyssa sinensis TaxID=561372 RepID=A0A5J5BBI6_9ASTE|nr:hypothetical protein F0562_026716 [Nyssa sinensis]
MNRTMLRAILNTVRFVALLLALFPEASLSKEENQNCSSSCGNLRNIRYPFHLKGDPRKCGDRHHELSCENNRTTLYLNSGKYYVEEISYKNGSIRLVEADLDQGFCSIPRNSLFYYNSTEFPYSMLNPYVAMEYHLYCCNYIYFVSCATRVNSSNHVNFSSCIDSSSSSQRNLYAVVGVSSPMEIHDSCTIHVSYLIRRLEVSSNLSISDIHQELLWGFNLNWRDYRSYYLDLSFKERFQIFWDYHGYQVRSTVGGFFIGRTSMGLICFLVFLVYKYRQRHLSMDDTIENFLESHKNFHPIRYSYAEIKAMTKGFGDKLGQGGYGSVFKGKVRSGHLVAIKVLGMSKANGQDFISEVATIGRIHHVNVVRLVGFCAQGSKRALVYDFMPNGSLDKFIFSGGENLRLSWERMYEIALGAARGIEYLHRGCDMQILHFDIKPHNVLLDENFIPKISDFGLAKLYPTDDSIVSLTAARGTLGYIAPELIYKNIGGISYKADVYSFGMLLMEMVGKRKNVDAVAEHSSQIYFPSWIYDHIDRGGDMQLGEATEEEKRIVRKMIIVALWCIQMNPVDRPSMSEVLQMLEGEAELLQMPPKPSLNPNEISVEDHADNNPLGKQKDPRNASNIYTGILFKISEDCNGISILLVHKY